MKGQGPFKKYHDFITNPAIIKLEHDRYQENTILHKLKHLKIQVVTKAPEWSNCVNISFQDYDKKLILNIIASKLTHDNKIPVEIAKSDNCIWVRTENFKF